MLLLRTLSSDDLNEALEDFTYFLSSSDVTPEEKKLIEHSRHTFLLAESQQVDQNAIHSESESDDPEDYVHVNGSCLNDLNLKLLVARKKKKYSRKEQKGNFIKRLQREHFLSARFQPRLPSC